MEEQLILAENIIGSLSKSLEATTNTAINLSESNKNLSEYLTNLDNSKSIECANNSGKIEINQFIFNISRNKS